MQTMRTIIWVIMAVILTIFAVANSQTVAVSVWPGFVAELPLSILIIMVFMLGFLPAFILSVGNRWRLGRQINIQEQVITQLRMPAPSPTTVEPANTPVSPPVNPL